MEMLQGTEGGGSLPVLREVAREMLGVAPVQPSEPISAGLGLGDGTTGSTREELQAEAQPGHGGYRPM